MRGKDRRAVSRGASDPECERLVTDLLAYMTPAEKAGQLAMARAPSPADREGYDVLIDDIQRGRVGCVHSIVDREQADFLQTVARDETRLGIPLLFPAHIGRGFETVLPSPLATAASWDADSVETAEAVVAQEAHMRGINWALDLSITINEKGSSTPSHSSGEDIYLAATMAVTRIRGLHGASASRQAQLLAQLDLSDMVAHPDEESGEPVSLLRLVSAVIDGGSVASLGFHRLTNSKRLKLVNALRMLTTPGSFDGIMLTQWQEIAHRVGAENIDVARDGVPYHALVGALASNSIDSGVVDDAVARVLRVRFRHGLLRAALASPIMRVSRSLPTPAHNREAALALARRCPVLLRNDPMLLPLGIDSGDILLVGPAAGDRHAPMPDYKGLAASVLDGMEKLGIPHRYVPGLALRDKGNTPGAMIAADPMAIGMANEAAKRAGTVILVLANDENGNFGEAQEQLLSALVNATPGIILINIGPCPVDPFFGRKPLACHLHAGQLGVMSGHAIAEILAGEFAPCGKLPVSIPGNGVTPGLPFGHGLTYADYALTNLSIKIGQDRLHAFVDLRNVSEREGTEVVQLYLRRTDGANAAALELAAFQRLSLRGGQVETLVFDIGRDELGRFTTDGNFLVEEGTFEIFVGLSSGRGVSTSVAIEADLARAIALSDIHPPSPEYEPGGRRRA